MIINYHYQMSNKKHTVYKHESKDIEVVLILKVQILAVEVLDSRHHKLIKIIAL